MAGARKKWRLKTYPAFRYEGQPSQRKAYERAILLRSLYAEGMSNVHQVDVEVDEGDGWRLFERAEFPERVTPARLVELVPNPFAEEGS